MDLQALIQALAQQAGVAPSQPGSAPSYADAMAQRRQFVQAAEGQSADAAQNAIQNGGVDGVRISSQDATSPLINFHTDNANKTAQLFQTQQANLGALTSLLNDQANRGIQQQGINLQERGQNLQYGIGDANGNTTSGGASGTSTGTAGLNGQQAITQVHNQHGDDILATATSDADRYRLAQQVLAAGGVANYRKVFNDPIAKSNLDKANQTNATLQSITRAQDAIAHSKKLQGFLDANPLEKGVIEMAIKSGNQNLLDHIGFSPSDIKAIGDLTTLSAIGDRDLIGGRLSGYLSGALNTAQPSVYKGSKDNQQFLKSLKENIANGVGNYSKQYGYGSAYDVPGIAPVKVKLSNGKTGSINPLEYDPSKMQLIQ